MQDGPVRTLLLTEPGGAPQAAQVLGEGFCNYKGDSP